MPFERLKALKTVLLVAARYNHPSMQLSADEIKEIQEYIDDHPDKKPSLLLGRKFYRQYLKQYRKLKKEK